MTSEYQKGVLELIENLKNRGAINNMERGRLRRAILVESERPHGEWIDIEGYYCECSNCKIVGVNELDYANFCPNCGADMREANDET